MLPLGMWWLAADMMAERRVRSESMTGEGSGELTRGERWFSISCVKAGQFALRKLVKVRLCDEDSGIKVSDIGREMSMGTWSELRVVRVDQEAVKAMSGVEIEVSGEVGVALVGILVGELEFRAIELDWVIWSAISEPLVSDREEYQRSSWALKSPSMRVVDVLSRR